MKKIIMQTLSAGPEGVFHPGQERTVDDKTAEELVKGRYAIYVDKKSKAETASIEAPEKEITGPSLGESEKKKGGRRK